VFELGSLGFTKLRAYPFFGMYERWFVRTLRFEFVPTVPTTQAGTVHMVGDYDPKDPVPTSDSGNDVALSMSKMYGYRSGPICRKLVYNMPNIRLPDNTHARGCLYCAPVENTRLTNYGTLLVQVDGVSGLSAGDVVGKIVMHYDIVFSIPQDSGPYSLEVEASLSAIEVTSEVVASQYRFDPDGSSDFEMTDGAGTPVSANVDELFTADIQSVSNGELRESDGTPVGRGSRIYFRAAPRNGSSYLATTAIVGGVSKSPKVDEYLTWVGPVTNALVSLANVYKIVRAAKTV
jgi:hypothetical protein